MQILRTRMLARVLAALVAASFLLVAFGPLLPARSERADIFAGWVAERLQSLDAAELAAVEEALKLSGVRSETGDISDGMPVASAEELASVLHDLFGRSIRDALVPRLFLLAAQGAITSVCSRILSGTADTLVKIYPPDLIEVLPAAIERGFRPAFERLSAARPLGP